MSGPAVVIGFILLVPSILGILFAGLTFIGTLVGSSQVPTAEQKIQTIKSGLTLQSIPTAVVEDVATGNYIAESRLTGLNTHQRSAIRKAEIEVSAAKFGTGAATACGVGLSFIIGLGSFVGGLLGWLLIMRKTVLQCFRCGAVVAAS
jgi:hypothetical protein